MSDYSPKEPEAEEMHVEDENRMNNETDDAHNILSTFLKAEEETLDELVGGFIYLTMEELRSSTASNVTSMQASPPDPSDVPLLPVRRKGTVSASASATASARARDTLLAAAGDSLTAAQYIRAEMWKGTGVDSDSDDDLVTLFPEDTSVSREAFLFQERPHMLTKFDNLFWNAGKENRGEVLGNGKEEGEEDWMPTSGYMASFGDEKALSDDEPSPVENTESEKSNTSKDRATQNQPAEMMIIPPPPPQHGHDKSRHTAVAHTRKEETRFSTQTLAGQGTLKNNEEQNLLKRSAQDGDQSVSASSACSTDGGDKDVDSGEVDDVAAYSVECDACDVEVPPASALKLNPGEAEEEDEEGKAPVRPRVRVLGVTTVTLESSTSDSLDSSQHHEDVCSDEVVPFELEQGYDYDTVVNTPKFTLAEMDYLSSFMPNKSS